MPDDVTVIDTATTIVANITGAGDLVVRGCLQGTVALQGKLQIEPGAEVQAEVDVGEADIGGELRGDLECSGRVILRREGRIIGQVRAARLIVESGATIQGEVIVEGDGAFVSPRAGTPEPSWRESAQSPAPEPKQRSVGVDGVRAPVEPRVRSPASPRGDKFSSRVRSGGYGRSETLAPDERRFRPRSGARSESKKHPLHERQGAGGRGRTEPVIEDYERVIEPVDVEPPRPAAGPAPSRRKKMSVRTRRSRKDGR